MEDIKTNYKEIVSKLTLYDQERIREAVLEAVSVYNTGGHYTSVGERIQLGEKDIQGVYKWVMKKKDSKYKLILEGIYQFFLDNSNTEEDKKRLRKKTNLERTILSGVFGI